MYLAGAAVNPRCSIVPVEPHIVASAVVFTCKVKPAL
jgi:hypothetical protein